MRYDESEPHGKLHALVRSTLITLTVPHQKENNREENYNEKLKKVPMPTLSVKVWGSKNRIV
jgi:hypothetical protein